MRLRQHLRGKENLPPRPRLESIWIKNFKSFGDWVEIPIRPITLIFGKNSAGKSTIIHSILWLRDLLPLGNLNLRFLSKGGDFVDLGGLHEYLHKTKDAKTEEICFRLVLIDEFNFLKTSLEQAIESFMELCIKSPAYSKNQTIKNDLKNFLNKLYENKVPEVAAIFNKEILNKIELEVSFDLKKALINTIKRISIQPDIKLKINNEEIFDFKSVKRKQQKEKEAEPLQYEKPAEDVIYEIIPDNKIKHLTEVILKELIKVLQNSSLYNEHEQKFAESYYKYTKKLEENIFWTAVGVYENGLKIFSRRRFLRPTFRKIEADDDPLQGDIDYSRMSWLFFKKVIEPLITDNLASFRKEFAALFGRLNYLAAYRKYPGRYVFEDFDGKESIDPYGSESLKNIFQNKKVLKEISTACKKLGSNFEVTTTQKYKSLFGKSLRLIHTQNKKELSFRDIGFGWSQVFPVLVEILSDDNSALLIEQPELHLHPNAQSELMEIIVNQIVEKRIENKQEREENDLLISNPIILEAHSEQMVLRLLNLVNQKRVNPSHCAILYVENEGAYSSIKQIKISDDGSIGNQWPEGFFSSGFKDMEQKS